MSLARKNVTEFYASFLLLFLSLVRRDFFFCLKFNDLLISSLSPTFPQLSPNSPKSPPKPPGNCSQLHPVAPTYIDILKINTRADKFFYDEPRLKRNYRKETWQILGV